MENIIIVSSSEEKKTWRSRSSHHQLQHRDQPKIAIFGFAFKKDTGDVRGTPAIIVCNMLLQDGGCAHVYDPKVKKEDAMTELAYHNM